MTKKLFECIIKVYLQTHFASYCQETVASNITRSADQDRRQEPSSSRTTAIVFSGSISSLFPSLSSSGNGPTIALLPAAFLRHTE
jgi:hypothetical protein